MDSRAYRVLRVLGWIDAVLFLLAGVGELILADDPFGHRVFFLGVLTLFAVLVLVGVRLVPTRWSWLGVILASIGAILGGLSLFWTGLAIVLAIAIVVLAVVCAVRASRGR